MYSSAIWVESKTSIPLSFLIEHRKVIAISMIKTTSMTFSSILKSSLSKIASLKSKVKLKGIKILF